MSSSQFRRGKRRFDDDESTFLKRDRHRRRLPPADFGSETFGLPEGDRWSTWDQSAPTERGPQPHPDWLVTDLAAVDTELGIVKTGKEAGVFLLRRGVPGTDRSCLLAAKRYRAAEHRTAAPRLAEIRPAGAELASLWDQLVTALCGLARLGYAHGRPVGLQPAGARQPAGHDRHAADRRPDREPARRGVLDQGRGERRALVHRPRADRSDAGAGRPGRPAARRSTPVIAGASAGFLLSA